MRLTNNTNNSINANNGGAGNHQEDWLESAGHHSRAGLLLMGGGGHALSVCEALLESVASGIMYERIAALDIQKKVGSTLLDIPIVGNDGDLQNLRREFDYAFVSLGGIGSRREREHLYELAAEHGYRFPNIFHPKAHMSRFTKYMYGIFAGIGVCVNSGSEIHEMSILNTGCIIEHECVVGAYAHIAPGAVLCGGVHIGEGAHIGAGSVVIQGIKVGEGSIIGAGSVVVRDIPEHVVAYGNPCRVIRPI